MAMENTKESALQWVKDGKPCIYVYGWRWKGAQERYVSQEEAQRMLDEQPQWSFGKGFYELSFIKYDGRTVLEFNELSLNDMW